MTATLFFKNKKIKNCQYVKIYKKHKDTHFKVIGLDRLKHHYRTHWPQIGDKVHQIVQLVIKQNLKPGETFTPLPPNKYIVTFGNITEEEADRRAWKIKKQILDIFLKDQRLSEHMDTSVKRVDENGKSIMPEPINIKHITVMIAHDKTLTSFGFYCTHEMPNGEILYEYDVLPEEADDDM